ncbi:MAG TPA: sulfotransferase [Acidimicrobiales bacterium]|nr:sulfotransferase [Acidimicrobiales bacterium]
MLGMHRGGTSMVTRLLNLLGVPVCRHDDLFNPAVDPYNPTGHWESRTMLLLNEQLLAMMGAHWAFPPVLPSNWEHRPDMAQMAPEAADAVRKVHPTTTWLCKDPRLCLTLPFWLAALEPAPLVVLVSRHPVDVAHSLEAREGFSLEHGLAAWERYLRSAIAATAGLRVHVVRYEDALTDPLSWSWRLQVWLAKYGVSARMPRNEDIEAFVNPLLCHSSSEDAEMAGHPVVSTEQRALHRLIEAKAGGHDHFTVADTGRETPNTDAVLARVALTPPQRLRTPRGILDTGGVARRLGLAMSQVNVLHDGGELPRGYSHPALGFPVWDEPVIDQWASQHAGLLTELVADHGRGGAPTPPLSTG